MKLAPSTELSLYLPLLFMKVYLFNISLLFADDAIVDSRNNKNASESELLDNSQQRISPLQTGENISEQLYHSVRRVRRVGSKNCVQRNMINTSMKSSVR